LGEDPSAPAELLAKFKAADDYQVRGDGKREGPDEQMLGGAQLIFIQPADRHAEQACRRNWPEATGLAATRDWRAGIFPLTADGLAA